MSQKALMTRDQRFLETFNQLRYPAEKFSDAVRALALGEGDVRSRLRSAYLQFQPVRADLLPDGLRGDYEWICSQLTKYPEQCKNQGRLDATLSRIRRSTGRKIAIRIYELNETIHSMLREAAGNRYPF